MKGHKFGGLKLNKHWIWQSDWNGDEVGFDDVLVVGLYSLCGTSWYAYLDVETGEILQLMNLEEEE